MMVYYETNRQVIHLAQAKRCSDQADHLCHAPRLRHLRMVSVDTP
jgi:hypothetical protein